MKVKRKSFPLIYSIIILLMVVYFGFLMSKAIVARNQKLDILAEDQSMVKQLNKDIDSLNKEIKNANTLDFVEKTARDDLGMVKPKEIIYIDKNKENLENNLQAENIQEDK
ncbi:FtsB family cell division protein [Peptoniphilus raoultii]|uniref:FtsB family cell division protein n=1 Tax=Peptoniphilus raoultii TaxID=1776387 RepID=UPI0008D913FD|nr:septum formation initiator family protein [Peptoniphilus raoultii]